MKNGVECVFKPINKKWAYKIYPTKKDRDFAFKAHRRALQYNIAPKLKNKGVIKKIKSIKNFMLNHDYDFEENWPDQYKKWSKAKKLYYYITEIAKPTEINPDHDNNFIDGLDKAKLGLQDIFYGSPNIGQINDKLVVIDFGPISVEK